jgi:ubiquinone/menaquinone biosynthesis C-methylase UbiE
MIIDWHQRFLQQASWTRELRHYLFDSVGLDSASHLLEVGCGTGAILRDLTPPADQEIHGLDLDIIRLEEAHRNVPAALLTNGDGHQLPYPTDSFDITYCHFMLLWVDDPVQVLREMKRVTQPGGFVLAMAEPDYKKRIDKPETLSILGRWQTEALLAQGADPGIGCRLDELFHQAGITTIEAGPLHPDEKRMFTQEQRRIEWAVLEADLAGHVPVRTLQKMKKIDKLAWQNGERELHIPTYYAWGEI